MTTDEITSILSRSSTVLQYDRYKKALSTQSLVVFVGVNDRHWHTLTPRRLLLTSPVATRPSRSTAVCTMPIVIEDTAEPTAGIEALDTAGIGTVSPRSQRMTQFCGSPSCFAVLQTSEEDTPSDPPAADENPAPAKEKVSSTNKTGDRRPPSSPLSSRRVAVPFDLNHHVTLAESFSHMLATDGSRLVVQPGTTGDRLADGDIVRDARQRQRVLREAFYRLTDNSVDLKDHAARCLKLAERVLKLPNEIALAYKRRAVNILINVTKADPSVVPVVMEVCTRVLIQSTEHKSLCRRLRHCIRTIIDAHGYIGHAALAQAESSVEGWKDALTTHPKLAEWSRQAATRLQTLPLSANEWLRALQPDTSERLLVEEIDEVNGRCTWKLKEHDHSLPNSPRKLATWNANSIFRRLLKGDLTKFLQAHDVDAFHISEIKGSVHRCNSKQLRAALAALGFVHVEWNWCVDTPTNHGSAVFSRVPIQRVSLGTSVDGLHDPEGRTITTHFGGFAVIWSYTPCSSMHIAEPEQRRTEYDTAFRTHVKRVQSDVGRANVFVCGDLNVAPHDEDTSIPRSEHHGFPSVKGYEKQAYFQLLEECSLVNAAEVLPGPRSMTWAKRGYSRLETMRLDHLLAPASSIDATQAHAPCLRVLEVPSNYFGSDHKPLVFGITTVLHEPAPQLCMQPAQPTVVEEDADEGDTDDDVQTTTAPEPECTEDDQADPDATQLDSLSPKDLVHNAIRHIERKGVTAYLVTRKVRADWMPPPLTKESEKDVSMEVFNSLLQCYEECITHDEPELVPVATMLPSYSFSDLDIPAHENSRIMPDAHMFMSAGHQKMSIRTLWDSGAFYNIITIDALRRTGGVLKRTGRLPVLQMADGHVTRPLGTAFVNICFQPGVSLRTEFLVMASSPYEAMMGTHFMTTQRAKIDYDTGSIALDVGSQRTFFEFRPHHAMPIKDAAHMHVITPVVVPPDTEVNVPIDFAHPRTSIPGSWGLVTDAKSYPVTVAKGLSYALGSDVPADGLSPHYFCRVVNASGSAVRIDTKKPLAIFKPLEEEYSVTSLEDWELAAEDNASERSKPAPASYVNTDRSDTADDSKPPLDPTTLEDEWSTRPHLQDLNLEEARKNLNGEHFSRLQRIILDNHELWNYVPKEPPDDCHTCHFTVKPGAHWSARTRPMAPPARAQLRELIEGQAQKGILEPSSSRFSSPIVLIPKKGGGIRFALDYRALNAHIDADSYTLPRVDEALSSLHGNMFFSSLDMKEAFWSVPLDEECREYTAFQTPDGLMQYRRMPMGLKTASAVFCRYVDHMLGHLKWENVLAYVDDLLCFSATAEKHLEVLEAVFERLRKSNMTLGPKKCTFFVTSVGFLGHQVSRDGVRPDPDKVKAIEAIDLPNSHADMERALGLFRYYRKFIANFSKVEAPLRVKMTKPVEWKKHKGKVRYTQDEEQAFFKIRNALSATPVLAHPDWTQPFELHTDASYVGLGAVLTQTTADGTERVISYASRSLTKAECNYAVWELECLAIVWALRLFRMYITGAALKIVTDSTAAVHIMGQGANHAGGRLIRWSLAVQEFMPFTIVHRTAKRHGDADGLSRLPLPSTEPYGEGPTDIDPASLMSAPVANSGTTPSFFGSDDSIATSAADFIVHQTNDEWCQSMAKAAHSSRDAADVGQTYRANNGLLMRKKQFDSSDQVLVPACLRAFLLRRYHGLPVSGHLGRKRSLAQISANYYWPKLSSDMRRWIAACLACRRRKTPRPLRAGLPGRVSTATRPWQVVAIDIVSAAATSAEGYTKILTIIDLFTRYVIAIPLKKANASEIGGALFSQLYCVFGKPERVHSDEGREFVNKALADMFARWDIQHTSTGGHQPQANPVERYHRFMNSSMTMLSDKFGEDWPSYLPAAVFSYNASTNDTTGFSPYELVFAGKSPTLLHDLNLDTDLLLAGTPNSAEYRNQAIGRLKAAYNAVRDQQERLAEANRKRIADKKGKRQRKLPKYEVDDMVLFWEPAQAKIMQTSDQKLKHVELTAAPSKWKSRWSGPHKITKCKTDDTGYRYTFYHKERGKEIETHVNKLCPFQPWSECIVSTSSDIDKKRLYKCGEWVNNGSYVVVPLLEPYPFGIAKVIDSTPDGDLTLQWYGNDNCSPAGTHLPAWSKPRSKGYYYAVKPRQGTHTPYTACQDDIVLNQRDVLIHGFELTTNKKLPAPLLRAIGKHPYVWWTPKGGAAVTVRGRAAGLPTPMRKPEVTATRKKS